MNITQVSVRRPTENANIGYFVTLLKLTSARENAP